MSKKTISTLLAIVLCVGIGIGGVKWYEYTQIEALDQEEKPLCNFVPEEISQIVFENDTVQTFVKADGAWENTAHKAVAYNQGLISNVAYQIGHLQSYKIVKNVKDASVYGINQDSSKVIVQNKEGEMATYWLGNSVPEENATFIWYEEKDQLALVKDINLASLMVPTGEMIEPFVYLPQAQDITKIQVKREGEDFVVLTKGETWEMTTPFTTAHKIDETRVNDYISLLETIKKESLIEKEELSLSDYGLEVPELQVVLNDTVTLNFGSKNGGRTYFRMNEEQEVYEIQGNINSDLAAIQPFEWIDKTLYTPERKTLSFIEVQYLDNVYRLDLKEAEIVPALNSVLIDPALKENILKGFETLTIDKHIQDAKLEETNPRPAEITIRYGYLQGEEVVFEFVPYDPSFYLVRHKGAIEFATAKKPLTELVNMLKDNSIAEITKQ